MTLAFYLALIALGTAVVWKGSDALASSSADLSRHHGLPELVEGAIVVAVGSSMPEITTTVFAALLHGQFDLGISVVVGSAIFNVLVIPGISAVVAGRLGADRTLVHRDVLFYLLAIAVLLLAFSLSVIHHPVEGERLAGTLTRPLALLPLLLYGLYLFLQQQEIRDHRSRASESESEKGSSAELAGRDGEAPRRSVGRAWLVLGASVAAILLGVEGLLRGAIFLGDHFDTPSFFWGVTVVAAATSIPDAFVSVKLAREDRSMVSLSNVLGSNIVDLLVAVPLGVLVAGASSVAFGVAVSLMLALVAATILLFALLRTELSISRAEGVLLLAAYGLFVAWLVLETLGVTSWIPTA